MGLRGQQVVLFLLVSLTPLFVVSLAIKVLGGNALKSSVGEGLVILAQEKLYRVDRAISDKIRNIRLELPEIQKYVIKANIADKNMQVYADVWRSLETSHSIRDIRANISSRFRGRQNRNRSELTITNVDGYVLYSDQEELKYDQASISPHYVKDQTWCNKSINNELGLDYAEDITYDAERGIHRLLVALPIRSGRQRPSSRNEKNVVGVIKVVLYLPELSNVVELLPDMEKAHTILTNEAGEIISVSTISNYKIGDSIATENAAARAIIEAKKGTKGKYHGYEAEGETDRFSESRVYGWARTRTRRGRRGNRQENRPIENNLPESRLEWKTNPNFSNWIMFVSYPNSEAYAGVAKLNQYVLLVTILSSVIVIPVAYVAAKRISQPVMQLAQTAKRIGQEANEVVQQDSDQVRRQIANMPWFQNDEENLISIDSKNEVGMLAQEFNDMHRNLKIAVEKLINAEQQMTTIVDCLGEGLIVVDRQDRILYFNPAAKQLLNISDASDFPDRFTDLLRETNLKISANTQETDARATVLDEEGENRVLRVVTSQFTSISTTTQDESLADDDKNMAGTVYVFDDITKQHEIDQMKSDFVALVSHELRTPLTSIIGFISLILNGKVGPLNDVQKQSLIRAHRQSERLAKMINDLLDISRIEAGRIVMNLEPVDIIEIGQQRIEELKPQADEKSIDLEYNTEPDLTQPNGDAEYIGQIFTNLIGNAIKFTPENGYVKVRITSKKYPRDEEKTDDINENDGIHVEVIDSGPGIPAEERENVFDKFRQLSNIQTREQGGTGLGLSIAQGFVEAHKGKIWVDVGDNDKGCNFQFWIPLLS